LTLPIDVLKPLPLGRGIEHHGKHPKGEAEFVSLKDEE
jgi:hypothetical protein